MAAVQIWQLFLLRAPLDPGFVLAQRCSITRADQRAMLVILASSLVCSQFKHKWFGESHWGGAELWSSSGDNAGVGTNAAEASARLGCVRGKEQLIIINNTINNSQLAALAQLALQPGPAATESKNSSWAAVLAQGHPLGQAIATVSLSQERSQAVVGKFLQPEGALCQSSDTLETQWSRKVQDTVINPLLWIPSTKMIY